MRAKRIREPLVISIASGSGGAGRTTLALELARVFGRRGVTVVVVDCALYAPIVASVLGRADGGGQRGADLFGTGAHVDDFVVREAGSSVSTLTLAAAVNEPDRFTEASAEKLLKRLKRLEDRIVLLDLPAGPQAFWLDLFVRSDVPILIAGPEAWSVRSVLPFVTRMQDRARELALERQPRTYLVLNGCRDASERELGEVLCHAIWRKLGHYPRYLGPVDFDDRRWFHQRHGDSCAPLSSSDGLGVQAELIAKRLLAVEDFDESRPRSGQSEVRGAEWLGLSGTVSPADLRSQYRRLWEGYRRESAMSQVVLDRHEREALIDELERTYRALQMALDDARVADAGTSTAAVTEDEVPAQVTPSVQATRPERSDREGCGALLHERRRTREMSLRELSLRTRIGLRYLEAIERMEVEALPAPVYLRGYLREIARALDLPEDSLLDRYLTEITGNQPKKRQKSEVRRQKSEGGRRK